MTLEDSFDAQSLIGRRGELLRRIRSEPEEELVDEILALEQKIRHLEKIAITDSLTELLSRRGLDQGWKRIFDHLRRHPNEDPGIMVLMDLNDFKRANDVYGHAIGDTVLVEFARVITEMTRQEDMKGRKGGDEFEMHLDGADVRQAELILERINQELMSRTKHLFQGNPLVSVSYGAVKVNLDQGIEELRRLADESMYKYKTNHKEKMFDEGEQGLANNLGLR